MELGEYHFTSTFVGLLKVWRHRQKAEERKDPERTLLKKLHHHSQHPLFAYGKGVCFVFLPDMVGHAYLSSTWESEVKGLGV